MLIHQYNVHDENPRVYVTLNEIQQRVNGTKIEAAMDSTAKAIGSKIHLSQYS